MAFADGFDRYEKNPELYHEAGFDAYITGVVFLKLSVLIAEAKQTDRDGVVAPLLHKVAHTRSLYTVFDLAGPEPDDGLANAFHCTFPAEYTVRRSLVSSAICVVGSL